MAVKKTAADIRDAVTVEALGRGPVRNRQTVVRLSGDEATWLARAASLGFDMMRQKAEADADGAAGRLNVAFHQERVEAWLSVCQELQAADDHRELSLRKELSL